MEINVIVILVTNYWCFDHPVLGRIIVCPPTNYPPVIIHAWLLESGLHLFIWKIHSVAGTACLFHLPRNNHLKDIFMCCNNHI